MRTWLSASIAAAGSVVLVASGTAVATAAPPIPTASTNTSQIAFLLTADGVGLAQYRLDTAQLAATQPVTGLSGDTKLVGIDIRVQNRRLYGVGDAGGIYVLNVQGVARKVKQLTTALDGTAFGVDFNPAANALRIISNTGQNLRQGFTDLTAATNVDGALNYTAGVTATGIAAAAYTNNDLSADSGTTLFDLDSTMDQIATQAPANNGSLQATGKLGFDLPGDVGFDIFSTTDANGRSTGNTGYAVVPTGESAANLYEVALLAGQTSLTRVIPLAVSDIAILTVAPPAAKAP